MTANATAARRLVADAARNGVAEDVPKTESVLFTGVPHTDVLTFLSGYRFHKRSSDGDNNRIQEYIRRRVRAGALGRWSVGVIGNSLASADTKRCDLGRGVAVRMVRRSRLRTAGDSPDVEQPS